VYSSEASGIALALVDAMLKALRTSPLQSTPDIVTGSASPRRLVVGHELTVGTELRQRRENEQSSVVAIATVGEATGAVDTTAFDVVASLPTLAPAAALAGALRALVARLPTLRVADENVCSVPAHDPRPAAQGLLRIVVHARRGCRLGRLLNALAPAVGPERITVVALRRDAELVENAITGLPSRPHVLLAPRDRGSAAAVLLAAYAIRRSDPDATLASIAAERGFIPGPTFVETLEEVARFVNRYTRWIVLLGERPDHGTSGSWIVPDAVLDCSDTAPLWRVTALRRGRPPAIPGGRAVFRATGVVLAKAARLVSRAGQLLPGVHSALLDAVRSIGSEAEIRALNRAYALIPRMDFTATLLEPSLNDLAVTERAGATLPRRLAPIRGVR
jgi:hypothetical protein